MKRSAFAAPIFSCVLILSPLSAQNALSVPAPSSPASAPRIVTVNFNAAVLGTAEAQKASARSRRSTRRANSSYKS
jgi:hypothetical protein